MSGDSFPAADGEQEGHGVTTMFMRVGGDVGYSNSWLASISNLHYTAAQRPSSTLSGPVMFNGSGNVSIASLVWKWSPRGNWHAKNFIFQAEYLRRAEEGQVLLTTDSGTYDGVQTGWYAQGVYQWQPRWRIGLRFDQINANNTLQNVMNPIALLPLAATPKRLSLMLDYSNSEFSRIRLQINHADAAGQEGTVVMLQYIMSLGAHGAHSF